ncbi:MAG: DUF4159 domain-containing protein [Alphaproteobacteria bacterium]|nr:MAG: DUF4159 domain-containing protein [Alphaproteobacteria bacterium]
MRDERPVVFLPTATGTGAGPASERQPPPAPETAEALRRRLTGLDPVPFSPDQDAAAARIEEMSVTPGAIVWLSDGLDHPGRKRLEAALAALGEPAVYADTAERTPLALLPLDTTGAGLGVTVRRPVRNVAAEVIVVARGADGRRLAEARARFEAGSDTAQARLDLPLELRNSVARVEVAGDHSAGTTILLDARAGRPRVGLSAGERRMESEPLRSPLFYLRRALEPFAELEDGPVEDLLANRPDVLVLADVGHMAPQAESAVRQFVQGGGLLIRFAGPHMEAGSDDLVPVRLRSGARAVGGALSWEKPQPLGPFPGTGPFAGLAVPDNVTVSRQLLAVPTLDLNDHVWARLADGTPLVTAARRGRGTLVLVHTSADAEWSNLVLSGLFVDMLKRLLLLARHPVVALAGAQAPATLSPLALLDGFGRLGPAPEGTAAIAARDFAGVAASPTHPPGLYGPSSAPLALNLASANGPIDGNFRFRPASGPMQSLEGLERTDHDLAPALMVAILLLALTDIVASLVLRGIAIPRWPRRTTAALLLLASCNLPLTTRAEAAPPAIDPAFAVAATSETRLGYVRTGDARIDRLTEAGLRGLGRVLELRTAVHLGAPMALDPERDPLSLFPLIYWPVPAETPSPSEATLRQLSAFLASGGIVLFDTGAGDPAEVGLGIENPVARQALQRLLARLDLPPLIRVEGRHILARSFYLLDSFPGRISGRAIWVTADSAAEEPRVSPLVIGGGDWAAAWAIDDRDHYLVPTLEGGIAQRERAFRFGVNLVMYALTGTYKGDQLHLPALIERLGE